MSKNSVLVTGGAGYIGSHAVLALGDAGFSVVVLDNLSTGIAELVPAGVPFVEGDIGDGDLVADTINTHSVQAVLHFAGAVVVPESVADPLKYYRENTCKSRTLIATCIDKRVRRFIFSSTAAVYGIPETLPVPEDAPTLPINPYGRSKLMTEAILRDTAAAHDLDYIALRYFNVAGADLSGRAGQCTPQATHLIKLASEVAVGRRSHLEIFGEDYDTPDGTCIRDYIHVTDLALAHLAALEHLERGGRSCVLNCGYGRGYSVREVVAEIERAVGKQIDCRSGPRRPGDAPALVADAQALRKQLNWQPQYDDLATIVRSAIEWERRLAAGLRTDGASPTS